MVARRWRPCRGTHQSLSGEVRMRKYAWVLFVVGAFATTGCNQAELKKALAGVKGITVRVKHRDS